MKTIPLLLSTTLLLLSACAPNEPEFVELPTEVCVKTLHHTQPIPDAVVYVKYHADSFPGYDKPATYFDAVFYTGKDARGCLRSVPEGKHWLVSFGYDSLYYPHNVWGSVMLEVSLTYRPKVDTVLYVSEEH